VPTLKERHFVFDHTALGYMILGNTQLTPERSTSNQLGVEVNFPHWQWQFNIFHNDISDLIATRINRQESGAQGLSIFDYQNTIKAMTQGAELSILWHKDNWRFNSGYNYLSSEDKSTGLTLPQRPRHQFKLNAQYQLPGSGSSINLLAIYQSHEFVDAISDRRSPGWSQWDVKFNHPLTSSMQLYLGVDNLTDVHRDVTNPDDFRPTSGRFFYLGFSIRG